MSQPPAPRPSFSYSPLKQIEEVVNLKYDPPTAFGADLRLIDGTRVVLRLDNLLIVEFAIYLSNWLDNGLPAGTEFVYESIEENSPRCWWKPVGKHWFVNGDTANEYFLIEVEPTLVDEDALEVACRDLIERVRMDLPAFGFDFDALVAIDRQRREPRPPAAR